MPNHEEHTSIDRKASRIIIDGIKSCFPKDVVVTEEDPDSMNSNGFTWIADPIDRTQGFREGATDWGTSLIVIDRDKSVVGAIYIVPVQNNVWFVFGKNAAYLNGDRLPYQKIDEPPVGVIRKPRNGVQNVIESLYKEYNDRWTSYGWRIDPGQKLSALDTLQLATKVGLGGVVYYAKIWDMLAVAAVAQAAGRDVTFISFNNGNGNRIPVFPVPLNLQILTEESKSNDRAFFVIT